MGKAIIAFIITLIVGMVTSVFSVEILNDTPTLGVIVSISLMGALIIYFNEKNK